MVEGSWQFYRANTEDDVVLVNHAAAFTTREDRLAYECIGVFPKDDDSRLPGKPCLAAGSITAAHLAKDFYPVTREKLRQLPDGDEWLSAFDAFRAVDDASDPEG